MKELFQSIFDSSTDRIKNPFIGSFATALMNEFFKSGGHRVMVCIPANN